MRSYLYYVKNRFHRYVYLHLFYDLFTYAFDHISYLVCWLKHCPKPVYISSEYTVALVVIYVFIMPFLIWCGRHEDRLWLPWDLIMPKV